MSVGYLPTELASELDQLMPGLASDNDAFILHRFAEKVFADGYHQGYVRRQLAEYGDRNRPNDNDLNEIREALQARKEG